MSIISQWVMQIIIFILIATIVDLLIPANKMKKYVHLVFGLLLLLIFTKPLIHLFSLDMELEIHKVERIMQENNDLSMSNNLLELQKREIQAEQNAYILKEVKENLISKANPVLLDKYQTEITSIELYFSDEKMDNFEHLDNITATIQSIQSIQPNEKRSEIETVVIDTKRNKKKRDEPVVVHSDHIKTELENIWELPKEQINLFWEGGAN